MVTLSQNTYNGDTGLVNQAVVASYPTDLTKSGTDSWNLTGASTTNGSNLLVTGGTLNITGTYGLNGGTSLTIQPAGLITMQPTNATVPAIVNMNAGSYTGVGIRGSNLAGGTSVYNQAGGTVTTIDGNSSNFNFVVGAVAGAYGMFNLTGGTYRVGITGAGSNVSGGRFLTNQGSIGTGFNTGVAYVGGGAGTA